MPTAHEVQHPLIQHHLARLREKGTRPDEFRRLIQRLASLLAYEATRDLTTRSLEIETPLTRMSAQQLSQRIGLVPIQLRPQHIKHLQKNNWIMHWVAMKETVVM